MSESETKTPKSRWGAVIGVGLVVIVIIGAIIWQKAGSPSEQTTPPPTATMSTDFSGDPVETGAERDSYVELAKETVTNQLTCPETAVYPEGENAWSVRMGNTVVEVSSTVEAQNTAGEKVVSSFTVQFLNGKVSYLKIDEAESGERVTE